MRKVEEEEGEEGKEAEMGIGKGEGRKGNRRGKRKKKRGGKGKGKRRRRSRVKEGNFHSDVLCKTELEHPREQQEAVWRPIERALIDKLLTRQGQDRQALIAHRL